VGTFPKHHPKRRTVYQSQYDEEDVGEPYYGDGAVYVSPRTGPGGA
jgi:hypothetical protein